jgi:hypothetical protein
MRIDEKGSEAIQKQLNLCCSMLMELGCDSVQINTTAHLEGDLWARYSYGHGNYYSRRGVVREWLETQSDRNLANEIGIACREEDGE